ncbi:MAG: Fic family protein [Sulfuritalea sp.]|nr:Fic family protein [Sulfuritalea sp.]
MRCGGLYPGAPEKGTRTAGAEYRLCRDVCAGRLHPQVTDILVKLPGPAVWISQPRVSCGAEQLDAGLSVRRNRPLDETPYVFLGARDERVRAGGAWSIARWGWRSASRGPVIAACHEQLAEHGGAADLGDTALLDSALARPENSAAHGKPDVALLAAAHGFGLVRKHPKLDGNKRAALIATELLLALNGSDLVVDNAECVLVVVALAAGELAGGGIPCVASRPRRAAPAESLVSAFRRPSTPPPVGP